jgi:hypothetical protein
VKLSLAESADFFHRGLQRAREHRSPFDVDRRGLLVVAIRVSFPGTLTPRDENRRERGE